MKLARAIPAGLIDAGLASVATFILSLYAIKQWQSSDSTTLGIFFLYMTAFVMASTVPNQLLFVPAERITLDAPQRARVALYGRIVRLGLPVAIGSASLVSLAAVVGNAQGLSLGYQAPFLITSAIAAIFFAPQTHARRLLHIAGHSWAAAAVSLVQVATAAAALAVITQTSIGPLWVPIGSLALANVASTIAASLILSRLSRALAPEAKQAAAEVRERIGYRQLAPSGRWLVSVGIMSTGNNFLVEAVISVIVGLPALALAGSAKTVAQPILVLANGLRSVLGPRSMEAAKNRDRAAARRVARTFALLTAAAVVGYSTFAGFAWVGNPLARLVEKAYSVPFLVVITIAANGLNGFAFSGRLELIGAAREARLFGAELKANLAQLVVGIVAALAAGSSESAGSFARPIAFAALGLTRIIGYERAIDAHYRQPAVDPADSTTIRTDLPPE